MINDILSGFLTKIRNANSSKHQIVEIVSTNLTNNVTKILKQEGFIYDFQILESTLILSLWINTWVAEVFFYLEKI